MRVSYIRYYKLAPPQLIIIAIINLLLDDKKGCNSFANMVSDMELKT